MTEYLIVQQNLFTTLNEMNEKTARLTSILVSVPVCFEKPSCSIYDTIATKQQ